MRLFILKKLTQGRPFLSHPMHLTLHIVLETVGWQRVWALETDYYVTQNL